jgi:hypothetical protein
MKLFNSYLICFNTKSIHSSCIRLINIVYHPVTLFCYEFGIKNYALSPF